MCLLYIIIYSGYCNAQYNSTVDFSYDKIDSAFSSLLSLDIYSPIGAENLPVVVFIHGGGWVTGDKNNNSHINKRNFFVAHDFIFVSINYRLAPDVTYPTYPQDVAKSIAFVSNWINKYGGDSNNIFLLAHSAGAHLAALVTTDESYLNNFGIELSQIKGVVLLDGAGYDIPAVIEDNIQNNNQSGINMYYNAFGTSPQTWIDASPISYVSTQIQLPPFQLFYVNTRRLGTIMSTRFFDAIAAGDNSAQLVPAFNTSHDQINKDFGRENDTVSQQALEFILTHLENHD
jgi:acetyl esterase/lipase